MDKARIDGLEIEYEVVGSGQPLLLISTGPIADSFLPLCHERELASRYQLIRYRQRLIDPEQRQAVSFQQHASDAASLLRYLGIGQADIAGHSTGACIGIQLTLDQPEVVRSLILLEPPLTASASAGPFFDRVSPSLEAYQNGRPAEAMRQFLSVVCSLSWQECQAVIDAGVPGGAESALQHADNFFESYLPALSEWSFGPKEAERITQPVLSFLGSNTDPFFTDSHELLHTWLPQATQCRVEGAAHLLHLQEPDQVIQGINTFLSLPSKA